MASELKLIDDDGIPLAACIDDHIDPEIFFDHLLELTAVSVCVECPIMRTCRAYALKNQIEHGVWGGLTETQRRAIKRNKVR